MITVVVKQPGEEPEVKQIDGSVESIQAEVGGYFEAYPFGPYTVYCNEDGKRKYMSPNVLNMMDQVLVGPILIMRGDDGLNEWDTAIAKDLLKRRAVLASNS